MGIHKLGAKNLADLVRRATIGRIQEEGMRRTYQ
jgi:hypothetical protein